MFFFSSGALSALVFLTLLRPLDPIIHLRDKRLVALPSWWFRPIWNILVKLDRFLQVGVNIKKLLEITTWIQVVSRDRKNQHWPSTKTLRIGNEWTKLVLLPIRTGHVSNIMFLMVNPKLTPTDWSLWGIIFAVMFVCLGESLLHRNNGAD